MSSACSHSCSLSPPVCQLVEDCAESFSGFEYVGHPQSDLTLFSFGSIKVCTGFGCGVARVRSRDVYDNMSRAHSAWAAQSRTAFLTKCIKNTLTMAALNVPAVSGATMKVARAYNVDHKSIVVQLLRGFPDRLMSRLRTQPSTAMLSMLRHRLANFDEAEFQRHQDTCDLMLELMPPSTACIPGIDAPVRNHWLFPVLVDRSDETLQRLNHQGVDAYKGATQLALVAMPEELQGEVPMPVRKDKQALNADRSLSPSLSRARLLCFVLSTSDSVAPYVPLFASLSLSLP